MTSSASPPPTPAARPGPSDRTGPLGWVGVAAGVAGLLALVLPWYTPKISGVATGSSGGNTSFHAWNGFLFLIGPAVLIGVGVTSFMAMRGQHNVRFVGSSDPLRAEAIRSIGAGVVAIVLGLVSIPILTATFKFNTGTATISWSKASSVLKAAGGSLSRGPQIGLYLLFIGGLFAIAAGALGLIMKPAAAVSPANGPSNDRQVGKPQFDDPPVAGPDYPPARPAR